MTSTIRCEKHQDTAPDSRCTACETLTTEYRVYPRFSDLEYGIEL